MREVTTTVYCDRCGKKIDTYNYGGSISIHEATENYMLGIHKDLCESCAISFRRWLAEGLHEEENKG